MKTMKIAIPIYQKKEYPSFLDEIGEVFPLYNDGEYRNEDGSINFVKLRVDSIELCEPKQDDWIMLADDDMSPAPDFEMLPEELFEKFEAIFCNEYRDSFHTFDKSRVTGVRTGFFFKFDEKVFDEFKSYRHLSGGGEDSLLAMILYKHGKKCIHLKWENIIHPGEAREAAGELFDFIELQNWYDVDLDKNAIYLFAAYLSEIADRI